MDASPAKRRVLAPLDANAQSPASNKTSMMTQAKPIVSRDATPSTKRYTTLIAADEPAAKRQCIPAASSTLEHALPHESTAEKQDRGDSASPEPSSIFDNSVIDTSQATCATEPDTENPLEPSPWPVRRPTITREEARQKAEILRLRLGLAGYKLRTGQEHVPLERLQVRRIPDGKKESRLPRLSQASSSMRTEDERTAARTEGQQGISLPAPRSVLQPHHSPEKNLLPRLPAASFNTPTRNRFDEEDGLTSSAIKGGAAKGLLSLSRG